MAPKGGKVVDITGLVARAGSAARYLISGITPATWMGPGQPLAPAAPEGTPGRAFDYQVGFNQQTKPRANAAITFHTLRELSRACDVLRLVIETRKDQIEALDWQIRPHADSKISPDDPRIAKIRAFFLSPSRGLGWTAWLRALLEDMFVLDAVAIEKRRDKVGRLCGLDLLNAATIALKLDGTGRTPSAPDVAYQQILKGIPAVDFSTDEMIYLMRNPRTDSPYGYGPVEQIITTINIALRRTASQLGYYTDGNLNAGVFWLPPEWTPDQVKAFNDWWESLHGGNQAEKSKAKFVPGAKDSFQQIVQPPLKDEFDEWLARVVCFAFSIAPTPFIKQMNRATAETSHDAALEEGLAPIQKWIKSMIDRIIADEFEAPDLEFAWVDDREVDPKIASDIINQKVASGRITLNESRALDGLDPYAGGVGDMPGIITATGFVPLPTPELLDAQHEAAVAGQNAAIDAALNPLDGKEDKAVKALAKKYTNPLDRAVAKAARTAIHKRVQSAFDHAAHHVASQLRGMRKADETEEERKAKSQKVADDLNLFDLRDVKAISSSLSDLAIDVASETLDAAGVTMDTGLFGQVSQKSVTWASDHAADLVTKITDSTRDMLRVTITNGLQETDIHGVADIIASSYGFSEQRALLIADTETAFANGQGALTGYRAARDLGIKIKKQWLDDPEACPICVANALDGPIDLDEPFSSGDMTTPQHPRCSCSSIAVIED
jgi:hypothetical protein